MHLELSHREQHRREARMLWELLRDSGGPTAEQYRQTRRLVAAQRRAALRRARIDGGTDRATLRAARA